MKLLCAFLIVVIHTKFIVSSHLGVIVHNMVSEGVCRIAVPFFFFAAGYFMSRHMEEDGWWWRELKKRIHSVLIPGVIFLFAYIAITYTLNSIRGGGNFDVLSDFGLDMRKTPLLVPTWFIRAFIIIAIISPILYRIFGKKSKKTAIMYLLLLAITVFVVRPFSGCGGSDIYYFFNYGLSLEGLLYFSAGIFLRYHSVPMPTKNSSILMLLVGVILFGLKFALLHWGYPGYAFRIGFFAIPFLLVGLYFSFPDIRLPTFLHNVSFPVYLIHVFVLSAIGGRCGARGDWALLTYDGGLSLWCCRVIVAFVSSLLIAQCIAIYFPRLNSALFGGRAGIKVIG